MKHVLKDWKTALLIPVYKKGDQCRPESYRPIALLSYIRKVFQSATEMAIRQNYEFSRSLLGFQDKTEPEAAIVRHIANAKSMNLTAVLDLTSLYDLVQRQKLYEIVRASQSWNILESVSFALQPVNIQTQGDRQKQRGW